MCIHLKGFFTFVVLHFLSIKLTDKQLFINCGNIVLTISVMLFFSSCQHEANNSGLLKQKNNNPILLNGFNINSKVSNIDSLIVSIGTPDSVITDLNSLEEFGFEIHELFYGNNSIIISDSYISDVWIRDTHFDINGLKIGDKRNISMIKYNKEGELEVQPYVKKGLELIDEQINDDKPIIVGVDWKAGHTGNADKTTDHWIIIVGRGKDDTGVYYNYFDPQTSQKPIGTDDKNKLYLQKDNSLKGDFRVGSKYERTYVVTMVRPSYLKK